MGEIKKYKTRYDSIVPKGTVGTVNTQATVLVLPTRVVVLETEDGEGLYFLMRDLEEVK